MVWTARVAYRELVFLRKCVLLPNVAEAVHIVTIIAQQDCVNVRHEAVVVQQGSHVLVGDLVKLRGGGVGLGNGAV